MIKENNERIAKRQAYRKDERERLTFNYEKE